MKLVEQELFPEALVTGALTKPTLTEQRPPEYGSLDICLQPRSY